ncbi:restriction endonuclease subunit S domain-containing protein [Devriesea agamarum]|uniref:restriction endonuclease subunit S n=1 Tax=Devriesea agamarum TaxID=472569 RepID=UPI00071DAC08|nr:restriction endonuclease subunit S [Devriesea agamarum]
MKLIPLRHWSQVPITNGLGLPGDQSNDADPRYIRTTDIRDPRSLKDDIRVSQPPETAGKAQVHWGDLLLVSAGSIGKSVLYRELSPACYAGFLVRVRPASDIHGEFLSYWTESQHFSDQVRANAVQSTIENFSSSRYRELLVPAPSVQDMQRIVAFLDEETAKIDHLIAKQRELLDLTTYRLQIWREHAFWGGATSDPFLNPPEGWEVLRNRHILEHVDGRSDTGEEEMLSVSHITGVTPRSMKNVTMFEAESTVGYRLVAKDELVINTMWAWMGALGVSQYEGIVSPAYDVYRFRDLDAVNPMFFDCMYRTAAYVSLMKANSRGIWESRLRLYPEVFLRLTSLVPSKDIQDRLVSENTERTAEAERLIARGNEAIELLQERRSALITAAVTGQIEV